MKIKKLYALAFSIVLSMALIIGFNQSANSQSGPGYWKWQYYDGDYGGACFPEPANCYVIPPEEDPPRPDK